MALELTRADVLGSRVRAQQLDRTAGTLADTTVLDPGVQDTGADAGRWALAVRGVQDADPAELALVWTIRGAPHYYRRTDLPGVAAATAPFSDADAGKRIFHAAGPSRPPASRRRLPGRPGRRRPGALAGGRRRGAAGGRAPVGADR